MRLSPFGTRKQFVPKETVKTVSVTRPTLKELQEWYKENAGKITSITRPAPPEIRNWAITEPCTDLEPKDWYDSN